MKPLKFVTAALGLVLVVAIFLPFWADQSIWEFMSMKRWEASLMLGAAVVVLAVSALAIVQRRLSRWLAVAIALASLAIVGEVFINFVPIFNDSHETMLGDLMRSGGLGAKLLFFGGAVGILLGAVGVIKPERGAA